MAKVRHTSDGGLRFECPACGNSHLVGLTMVGKPRWHWNGDVDKPTLNPSVSVTWTEPSDKPEEFDDTSKDILRRCHSFVRDGKIQYLDDCTHALAGKTVELPDLDA